jgi:tetratricopeptide (TPR) repeat protein
MPAPSLPLLPAARSRRWWLALGLLLVAAAVWHPALRVPFLFDDRPAIERNPSIRSLWPLPGPFAPPVTAAGASGRPLVNLSLALNHAMGGLEPWGYHLFNVGAHAAAALLLAAVIRRALAGTAGRAVADSVAGWTALLWLVHPLQTETVVCVVQRNEILVALCQLLVLYGLGRAADEPGKARWPVLTVAACLAGMAAKEVMVVAPVLAFLHDRTFLAGTWAEAWRRRGRLHLALAACWVPLALLVAGHQQRDGTAGFGVGVGPWTYLLTQCDALTTYLRLCLWPHPLVADYGFATVGGLGEVAGRAALLCALTAASVSAIWLRPAAGFAAVASLALLAPSSSFVPLATQTAAEHRMYLPLAGGLVLAVAAAQAALGRARLVVLGALALACAGLTVRRQADYASEERLWTDTVAKVPDNPRAHASLGGARARRGDWTGAVAALETAVRLRPDYADAQSDLGTALGHAGRPADALPHHQAASRLKPDDPDIRFNLGAALQDAGRPAEALPHLAAVTAARPGDTAALGRHVDVLLELRRPAEALVILERALALQPDDAAAHNNVAIALGALGRMDEARARLARAAALAPDRVDVRVNYGDALLKAGQPAGAAEQYAAAARLRPDWPELPYNLGNVWAQLGRHAEAAEALATAVRLKPDWVPARHNLALALMQLGRPAEAVPHYAEVVRSEPRSAAARHNLALALAACGRMEEARREDEAALGLQPGFLPARRHLDWLRGR